MASVASTALEGVRPMETIVSPEGETLAYFIPNYIPDKLQFLSPGQENPQFGFIVYPKGHEISPHFHYPIVREVKGTPEVLVVRKGRMQVDIFLNNYKKDLPEDKPYKTFEMRIGDILVMVGTSGSHGFTMLEDTVLLEVKQGPYAGASSKDKKLFKAIRTEKSAEE